MNKVKYYVLIRVFFRAVSRAFALLVVAFSFLIGLLLYLIIFQVHISYLNKYIEHKVFNNRATIKSINIKWDYRSKRPIFIINNLTYLDKNKSISFRLKQVGLGFSFSSLIHRSKILPIYISFSGLKLDLNHYNKTTFINPQSKSGKQLSYDLIQSLLKSLPVEAPLVNLKKLNKSSILKLNKKTSHNTQYDIYSLLSIYKKKYPILSKLRTINIKNSEIKFKDQPQYKDLILTVKKMRINENLNTKTIIVFSKSFLKSQNIGNKIEISGSTTFDHENVISNYHVLNIPIKAVFIANQIITNKTFNNIHTSGLNTNMIVHTIYNFSKGLKSLNGSVNISKGSIFLSKVLKKKILLDRAGIEIKYNANNNNIYFKKFYIKINRKSPIRLSMLNNKTYLTEVDGLGSINLKSKNISFDHIKINIKDHNKLSLKFIKLNDNIKVEINSISKIMSKDIKDIWPKGVTPEVRSWVLSSIYEGVVDRGVIRLDFNVGSSNNSKKKEPSVQLIGFKGKLSVSNVLMKYLQQAPKVRATKAEISFNQNNVTVEYINAKMANLSSKQGNIKLFENSYKGLSNWFLLLDLNISGSVRDGLSFINKKPFDFWDNKKLPNINRFEGFANGNVSFMFNLDKKDMTKVNIDLIGHNISFHNAFANHDVTNVNLKLKVTNDEIISFGSGEYFDTPIDIYLNTDFKNNKKSLMKLGVKAKSVSIEKIDMLNIMPKFIKKSLKGKVDLSVEIQYFKESNQQNIISNLDLRNAEFKNFPFLDYTKPIGDPLKVNMKLRFKNSNLLSIDSLDVFSTDTLANLKINFDNSKRVNILLNTLKIKNKSDIKGYISISNNDIIANIQGKLLNYDWLVSSILKSQSKDIKSDFSKVYKKNINHTNLAEINPVDDRSADKIPDINSSGINNYLSKNYQIKLNIDKLISDHDKTSINKLYIDLSLDKKRLNSLVISGNFNDISKNITFVYNKSENKIVFNVDDMSAIFRLLGINNNTKRGKASGSFNFIQDENLNVITDGSIVLKNIDLGDYLFKVVALKFIGHNYKVDINNLSLKGNLMGGNLSGIYNLKIKYIDLDGYITPMWGASYLLGQSPILGNFLKSKFAQNLLSSSVNNKFRKQEDKSGGIFNVSFRMYGIGSDTVYQVGKKITPVSKYNNLTVQQVLDQLKKQ